MRWRMLFLPWPIVFFVALFDFTPVKGDYIYSDVDTYRVVDAWGTAVDTVKVPIFFSNDSLPVGGLSFRLEYDSLQLSVVGVSVDSTRLTGLNWILASNYDVPGVVKFVGATLNNDYVHPGAGLVAFIFFRTTPGVAQGKALIRFQDDPDEGSPIQNFFSDSGGTGDYVPIQIGGYIRGCSEGNCPPVLKPVAGGDQRWVYVGDTLSFDIFGFDIDGDRIALFADGLPSHASFPFVEGDSIVAGTFTFAPDSTQEGGVYSAIFTVRDDGFPPRNDVDTVKIFVTPAGLSERSGQLSQTFSLWANYPNPFNSCTVIPYVIPEARRGRQGWGKTTVRVYNLLGKEVRNLVDEYQPPGNHRVVWDGKDDRGHEVTSGIYLYRLEVGAYKTVRRMTFLR